MFSPSFVLVKVFAFYLGNEAEGELLLGGTDSDHYNGAIRCAHRGYWLVNM